MRPHLIATAHLDDLCPDRHLRVRLRPTDVQYAVSEEDREAAYRAWRRATNYGIAKVERLPGNIGLIELHGVTDPAYEPAGGRSLLP